MSNEINRRDLMRQGVGLLAMPLVAAAGAAESLRFRLTETAGLRRFGYPVHLVLEKLPKSLAEKGASQLALLRDGKPVPAQFREEPTEAGKVIVLDFATSPGPLESEEYAIVLNEKPAPATSGGMTVEEKDGVFRVKSAGSLHYEIPTDLKSFLTSVGNNSKEYIDTTRHNASRIGLHTTATAINPGDPQGKVLYEGRFACAIRYSQGVPQGSGIEFEVRLHFPSSKSWIEGEITIIDPQRILHQVVVDLPLKLDGSPTLIDLGTNDTVYGQIKGDAVMSLSQGPGDPWKVTMGGTNSPKPFAISVPDAKQHAEGWAHVMDRQRCTAAAIADFGREHADVIETHANGQLSLHRTFVGKPLRKSFRFWLHFVPMPVQVGALTSPQAMLAPLKTTWL